MKRSEYSKFPQYEGLASKLSYDFPPFDPVFDNGLKEVLDEIFSVDPVTGNPRGDIQYFMSKDGNPQVKAWLESHLLQPRIVSSGFDSQQISDDLIAEFSRGSGESVSDYQERLTKLRAEAEDNYKKLLDQANKTE